jgi:DNA-binding NarL/FixJ family response regulator
MELIRVVVADDHPGVRRSIRRMLESAADIDVVGEAANGWEAIHLVEELAPDVLLLDMEMPGLNGLEVARRVQNDAPAVCVVALSAYDDHEYIEGMLANGAAGYLTKDEAPSILVQAMRRVMRGERGLVSERVASKGRSR